jgi:hypothetical protein
MESCGVWYLIIFQQFVRVRLEARCLLFIARTLSTSKKMVHFMAPHYHTVEHFELAHCAAAAAAAAAADEFSAEVSWSQVGSQQWYLYQCT